MAEMLEDRAGAASSQALVLVEDNPADARFIQEMALGGGPDRFELTAFSRLAEARSHLRSAGGACVLLDLSLPDATGLEAVETLRAEFAEIPIVIITGLDDEEAGVRALQAGAQDYLIKGRIDGEAVRRAVRYAVERKRGEREVARLGRQNELILNSAGEGICGLDASGAISFANPAAAKMLGWEPDELVGRAMHDVVHGSDPGEAGHSEDDCPIRVGLREISPVTGDDSFRRRSGATFSVECTTTPIVERTELLGGVVTFSDVTERKRFESQLQHLADHDALTSLFNRNRFQEELTRQLAHSAHYGGGGAVLILDLDNFKHINDAFGHHAGDEVIRSIAGRLARRLRAADVVSRLGGDEFGILLSGASVTEARSVAEELVDLVGAHACTVGARPMRVTASVGIALLDRPELTAEQVLVEADVAMYEAKDAGRNRAVLQRARSATGGPPPQAGLVWTDRIRHALERDQLVVHCQPIVSLSGVGVARFELLVRMAGDDGALIPPGAFLPAAERFGLVKDIDVWMVKRAVSLIQEQARAGREVALEVNVSGRSIGDPGFPVAIERTLDEASIDPARLVLEITETAAVANMDQARQFAGRIKGLGCEFALDDFGAGFGSFYYLKYFPLDYLKIDGEFVRSLPRSRIDQQMVRAMVDVARGLGLGTIAEFVETREVLTLLQEYGVDFAQGYYPGRPGPTAEQIGA